MTDLCSLMTKYGSDKNTWHNYTQIYFLLLEKYRNENINLFEMGIGTNNVNITSNMGSDGRPGASLRAWSEFFPNATIFAADIDKNILFQEEKIKTFYCDQLSPEVIQSMWSSIEVDFDIIIDDGLHTFEANVCLFENSIHKLKEGGIYIIEDVYFKNLEYFRELKNHYTERYGLKMFEIIELHHPTNGVDNNLIIIRK
jgi:SAM-dependent methyltransferase